MDAHKNRITLTTLSSSAAQQECSINPLDQSLVTFSFGICCQGVERQTILGVFPFNIFRSFQMQPPVGGFVLKRFSLLY